MPIYEFNCPCGNEREELVPMGTNSIKCTECGGAMKKLISKSSFHLKGSGWYSTDYGNNSEKKTKDKKQG